MILAAKIILTCFVLLGALPMFASLYQFILVIFHGKHNHYKSTKPVTPRVAVVIPCWNEADVIGNTIEHLLSMDYPSESLKLYIVDDASTDNTSKIIEEKFKSYPDNIHYVKREKGGQGKAHTLNAGLKVILEEDWAEAVLIIDADVLFEKTTLKKMVRHLANPEVGAVMAYIKEGSTSNTLINKFIAFEYICAQAASRRAQNVLGATACLAGGAQLLTKSNLIAIGGQIDTSSLAEDTFTTFKTQLIARKKAVFDASAIVWAEEPNSLVALWKQRLRWARGNIQVTKAFKHIWLNKEAGKLGSFSFAFIWFTILFMPILMILASIGLTSLFFLDFSYSWLLFKQFWILNTFTNVFIILTCNFLDPKTAKKTLLESLLFPGIISFCLIILSLYPNLMNILLNLITVNNNTNLYFGLDIKSFIIIFFLYLWISFCMIVSYMAYYTEKKGYPSFISRTLLLIGGYGPYLCAITFASYIKEITKSEMKWDKTQKTGNAKTNG